MTDQAAAPAATETNTVPVAALQSLQEQLAVRDEVIANKDELLAIAEAEVAAAKAKSAAQDELIKALEAKKLAAEIRAEELSRDANVSHASSKKRFRIQLDEARDKTEAREVDVGVNGRTYKIKRGVPVDVPEEVVSVLNDAVAGRAESITDERTGIESGVEYVNARRFPFQNFGQSKDENGDLRPGFDPL